MKDKNNKKNNKQTKIMNVDLTKDEVEYIREALIRDLEMSYITKSYKERDFEDFENYNFEEIVKYPKECFEEIYPPAVELIKNLMRKLFLKIFLSEEKKRGF